MRAWWRTPCAGRNKGEAGRLGARPRHRRPGAGGAHPDRAAPRGGSAHTNRAVADLKGSFEQIITQIGRQLEQMRGQFDTTSRGMHEAAQKTATDLDGLAPGDAEAHGDAARADRSDDGRHPQGPLRSGEGDRGDHAGADAGGDASRRAEAAPVRRYPQAPDADRRRSAIPSIAPRPRASALSRLRPAAGRPTSGGGLRRRREDARGRQAPGRMAPRWIRRRQPCAAARRARPIRTRRRPAAAISE